MKKKSLQTFLRTFWSRLRIGGRIAAGGICLISLLILGAGNSLGASYEVTRVIEVGPAAQALAHGSVRWSPDGTKLAYFANNYLMTSDTLGNSREVVLIPDLYPFRAEWVSDDKIAVSLQDMSRQFDSALYRLVVYNVNTAEDTIVEEYWRTRNSNMPGDVSFEGPYITVEGNAYYKLTTITGQKEGTDIERRMSCVIHIEYKSFPSNKDVVTNDHVLSWQGDGLYEVPLWQGDSTRITPRNHHGIFNAVSPDKSYVVDGGCLINTNDNTVINLDTIPKPRPTGAVGCSFDYPSFNPKNSEVLGIYGCDDEEKVISSYLCIYDYSTNTFTDLGSLTGIEGGAAPIYAPDGRKIAVRAKGKIYIIYREEK